MLSLLSVCVGVAAIVVVGVLRLCCCVVCFVWFVLCAFHVCGGMVRCLCCVVGMCC